MILIASFPRSGNLWVRFIVTSLIYGNKLENVNKTYIDGEVARKTHSMGIKADKIIYIVRNPVNVFKSFKGYYNQFYKKNVNVNEFIYNNKYGRWDSHVLSWIDKKPFIIKYEDMEENLKKSIENISTYINIEKPVDDIYKFASTEAMKKMQEYAIKNKISCAFYRKKKDKIYNRGIRLISTRTEIMQEEADLICNEFKYVMEKLDYNTKYKI